jgi:hypothetical protein
VAVGGKACTAWRATSAVAEAGSASTIAAAASTEARSAVRCMAAVRMDPTFDKGGDPADQVRRAKG